MSQTTSSTTDRSGDEAACQALVPHPLRVVRESALQVLRGPGYRVSDVREDGDEIVFACPGEDDGHGERTYRVELGPLDGGGTVAVVVATTTPPAQPSRAGRRRGRRTASRVLEEIRSAVEERQAGTTSTSGSAWSRRHDVLARLSRRRASVGSLLLVGAYATPVLLVWLASRAAAAGWLDDLAGPVFWVSMLVGLAMVVGLTTWLGGWFRGLDFGEEYMVTFRPVAGYAMAWLRLALQIGSLVGVAVFSADIEDLATTQRISNAESAALPAYASRAPVPEGGELLAGSGDLRQNPYADGPNATWAYEVVVPAGLGTDAVEAWMTDPAWAEGDGQGEAIGALRDVECDTDRRSCEAEVVPAAGRPVEHTVSARVDDGYTSGSGEEIALLRVEITYEEAD